MDDNQQRREDNARLFVALAALIAVLGISLGVTAYRYRVLDMEVGQNRDGIACVLETLAKDRDVAGERPTTLPPPTDQLAGTCERFFKED